MKPRLGEFDWTADRIALLERWWLKGISGGEIGRRLGTSRCSVIGKTVRLGLQRARTPAQIACANGHSARLMQAMRKMESNPKGVKPEEVVHPVSVVDSRPVPFIQARSGQCLYPLWEFPAKTGDVCGAETGGRSFCAFHTRVCRRSESEARARLR